MDLENHLSLGPEGLILGCVATSMLASYFQTHKSPSSHDLKRGPLQIFISTTRSCLHFIPNMCDCTGIAGQPNAELLTSPI